jgi:hypothetical protein
VGRWPARSRLTTRLRSEVSAAGGDGDDAQAEYDSGTELRGFSPKWGSCQPSAGRSATGLMVTTVTRPHTHSLLPCPLPSCPERGRTLRSGQPTGRVSILARDRDATAVVRTGNDLFSSD